MPGPPPRPRWADRKLLSAEATLRRAGRPVTETALAAATGLPPRVARQYLRQERRWGTPTRHETQEQAAMSTIEPDHFRRVLGHVPTGVAVVTGDDGHQKAGLAVGSFFSVSLEPPLVGFCVGRQSSSWPVVRAAGRFCLNVLRADQEDVCRAFARRADDKFAGIAHGMAPFSGAPRLDGAVAWIDCELETVHTAGDHDIVIGRVRGLDVVGDGGPLVFHRGAYTRLAS